MTNLISSAGRSVHASVPGIAGKATVVGITALLVAMNCNGQTAGCVGSTETTAIGIEAFARKDACGPRKAGAGVPVEGTTADSIGSGPAEQTLEKSKNEFGVWAGGSMGLAAALGGSRDRKIPLLIALRYGRVLAGGKYAALEYTFDVVPVAVVSGPKGGFSNPGGAGSAGGGRDYVYGAGFIPVGFKLFIGPQHRFKPYVTVSSGPFYFAKQVPVPDSARFNFISTGGGGVQIFISSRRAISIEYRVGHLSNAGVGNLNPGFNSGTIHVGFSVFR